MTLDPRGRDLQAGSHEQAAQHRPAPTRPGPGAERHADVAHLIIEVNGQVERVFALTEPLVTIGRTPSNALPLQHESVSRQHAELRLTPDGLILTDLGSKNGTSVGSTRLAAHQPVLLRHGSIIRIGPFVLRYEVAQAGVPGPQPFSEERSTASAAIEETPAAPPPMMYAPPPPPRDHLPMPLPNSAASNYLDFLPIIFHDSDFMSRFLLIFQSVWEPLEQRQDHLAMYFDPRTCPASFLHWLAGWLGISVGPRWPEGRLRTLLAEAVELYRWRGTRYGLTRMIEVCTGVTPVVSEAVSNPFLLHIRVAIPPESDLDRDTIERLVIANKPAHTAYLLEIAS